MQLQPHPLKANFLTKTLVKFFIQFEKLLEKYKGVPICDFMEHGVYALSVTCDIISAILHQRLVLLTAHNSWN